MSCTVAVEKHVPVPLHTVENDKERYVRFYQADPSGRTVEVVGKDPWYI